MYPVDQGAVLVVQQQVSGTGRFTGADYGRSKATLPGATADADVRVASRVYGVLANGISVELVDRGVGTAVATTYAEQAGSVARVYLRRGSSGVPLATANEVAQAICDAAYPGAPLCAVAGGNGSGLCTGASPVQLSGGRFASGVDGAPAWSSVRTYAIGEQVTYQGMRFEAAAGSNLNNPPDLSPSWWRYTEPTDDLTYRWGLPPNTNAGLFHFEQNSTLDLLQLEMKFTVPGGTHSVTVSRCPLNRALEPVLAEKVPILHYPSLVTGAPDISLNDIDVKLAPRWAFLVETSVSMPGIVRMDVRRTAYYPFP